MAHKNPRYLSENPEPRKVEAERVERDDNVFVSPAHPDFLVDLSPEQPLREHYAQMDEMVGPDHPAAVILPPEGMGTHPVLFGEDLRTAEELLADGDAPEATGVLDGRTMTASEAEDAEK